MNPYIRIVFYSYFPFSLYFYQYFLISNPKITFPPSMKGFQSLKGVWKNLIGKCHFYAHLLLSIDHFRFLNLKMPQKFLDFNLLTFLPIDSTSTCHFSNLQIRFEELNIIYTFNNCIFILSIFNIL